MIKEIIWMGSSKKDLTALPEKPRSDVGFELYNVQLGLDPSDWKVMPNIGKGEKRYEFIMKMSIV